MLLVDRAGEVLQVNPAVSAMLAYDVGDVIGANISKFCREPDVGEIHSAIAGLFSGDRSDYRAEMQFQRHTGGFLWCELSLYLVGDNAGRPPGCLLQLQDISERKQASLSLQKQSALTRLLGRIALETNEAATLDEALRICLDQVCEYTGWPVGHAYLADDKNKKFVIRKFRCPEQPEYAEIRTASNSIKYSVSAGLPGRVMRTHTPVWISDFNHVENFPNAKYLVNLGLQAGFAFPVFSNNELVAVLEFFSRDVTESDFEFLEVMSHIGVQLSHVSKRETSRHALQLSEEKFATAFRSSPDAIAMVSMIDGKYIDINQRFLQLFGYRRHEVVGNNIGSLSLWDQPEQEQVFTGALREHGMVHDLEVGLRNSAGATVSCLVSAEIIDIGGVKHVLVIYRDITERIETTNALKRSERLLRSYFNAGFVGMAIVSPDNRFIQVNDTVSDIFAYPQTQLLGMSINDLICPEDVAESASLFNSIITRGIDGYSGELRCLRQDGNIITVSLSTECVRKDDGSIDYLVAFFQDITKRKQSELELRDSEASLRKAQHIAHLGFWETDLVSDKLFISDEIYTICSIDRQGFNNDRVSFLNLIHPDDQQRFIQGREEMISSDTTFNMEYRILRRDGTVRYAHTQAELIRNSDGDPIRMVGTLLDITERKTAEIALSRSNRALRVLNQCIHTIVHAASGQEMIEAVCNTIIETGGYRFAWVGYAQSDIAKTVYPVSRAGHEAGYLDNYFSWNKDSKTFDPVSDAIASGKLAVVNNLTDDNVYGSLRNAALVRGYRSEIALPLKVGSQAFGALMIYAAEPDAFDAEEIQLLTSLADDLAYGILSLHSRAEHERSSRSLRNNENHYRLLYDANPSMFFTVDEHGIILSVNRYGAEQLGYRVDELVGRSIFELSLETDKKSAHRQLRAWLERPDTVYKQEQRKVAKDGSVFWVNESIRVLRNSAGDLNILIVCADITATRRQADELAYRAIHDSLTGLINRGEFEQRLRQLLGSARSDNTQHALCYLDLDQFRVINDSCGHVAGDELLRQLGALLLGKIRKRDTAARLGGDEFVVLMEHCPLPRAEVIAGKILQAIEDFQFVWDKHNFRLAVNIGLVPINNLSGSMVEVMNDADRACYTARDLGRNRLHVLGTSAVELAQKHGEIRRRDEIRYALEHDGFQLYFQSIESLQSRKDEQPRFEVLLRMNAESGGLLTPEDFMPVAERCGLSVTIDQWVINKLFELLTVFQKQDRNVPQFFVNLSGYSLGDDELLQFIVKRLGGQAIAPEKICFEITETVAIANLTQAVRFINVLRESGCYFALDDFGSGLSSYAYLKNLQVDYLKIDGFFVKGIASDPVNLAIVKSMHEIGKALGKQTIAESVEDKKTRDILQKIGLDYVQGNFIAAERTFAEISRGNPANIIEFSKKG
ncbi:MAG: diguanylate cyclase [Gammaproteobacteria bacterium]|nr:diguanylate cyclase [Gammaproteobacteria bacterium]